VPYRRVDDPVKLRRLLQAVLMIEGDLSLPVLLRHLVEEARALSGARFGALGVLNESRTALDQFITVGLDAAHEEAIGPRPQGHGVLGLLIVDPVPLRLSRLADHVDSYGIPEHHPEMTSFLGVPVKVRDEVYGNLYLTNKRDGAEFDEEDEALVSALAVAAGVALENARLHARVQEIAVFEDRDRIARDLHDTVIQRLFAVGLSLQGTARLSSRPEVVGRIERAVEELDETIRQLRTAIFDLEVAVHQDGLRRGVIDLIEELVPVVGLRPKVTFGGPVDSAISAAVAEHLLATLREALTNVAKHAQASSISVTVSVADDLLLVVADNGRGIDPEAPVHVGHGLKNLRMRAESLGGSLEVESPSQGGMRLAWRARL
jgi:signal transduction histidine kinase